MVAEKARAGAIVIRNSPARVRLVLRTPALLVRGTAEQRSPAPNHDRRAESGWSAVLIPSAAHR